MATTYPSIHTHEPVNIHTEQHHVLHSVQVTLKYLYGLLGIVAGADKFTNLICRWEDYLNPAFLRIVPVTAHQFMLGVGIIEIIAGLIVFMKPRVSGMIITLW